MPKISSPEELLAVVSYEDLARVALRGGSPERHRSIRDDQLTNEDFLRKTADAVTGLLRTAGIEDVRTEAHVHQVNGSRLTHRFTAIPLEKSGDSDVVIDAAYFRFIPPRDRRDRPVVFVGRRKEEVDLIRDLSGKHSAIRTMYARDYLPLLSLKSLVATS